MNSYFQYKTRFDLFVDRHMPNGAEILFGSAGVVITVCTILQVISF